MAGSLFGQNITAVWRHKKPGSS